MSSRVPAASPLSRAQRPSRAAAVLHAATRRPVTLLLVDAACPRTVARVAQFDALAVACGAEAGVVLAGDGSAVEGLARLGLARPVTHDPARRLVAALGGVRLPALVRIDVDGQARVLAGACTPRAMADALAGTPGTPPRPAASYAVG